MSAMFWLITLLVSLLVLLVLTLVGIQRGLQGAMVIFSGWGDFALTCVLILLVLVGLPTVIRDSSMLFPMICVGAALAALWFALTLRNTHQVSELWFSIPSKLCLVSMVILGTLLAISCAQNALKDKATPSERLKNGILAVGATLLAAKAIGLSRTLIHQASCQARVNSNNHASNPLIYREKPLS